MAAIANAPTRLSKAFSNVVSPPSFAIVISLGSVAKIFKKCEYSIYLELFNQQFQREIQ